MNELNRWHDEFDNAISLVIIWQLVRDELKNIHMILKTVFRWYMDVV